MNSENVQMPKRELTSSYSRSEMCQQIGGGRPARVGAADMWTKRSARRNETHAPYPKSHGCGINELPGGLAFSIAGMAIATAEEQRRICADIDLERE